MLVLLTAYGSAAMGQLFIFHVVLIRKVTFTVVKMLAEQNYSVLDLFI